MAAVIDATTNVSVSDRLLIGVMVDVSGSMKSVLDLRNRVEKANVKRSVKVFQVVSNLAHRVARSEDKIAVTAFGTQFIPTCDLLQLLARAQKLRNERKGMAAQLAKWSVFAVSEKAYDLRWKRETLLRQLVHFEQVFQVGRECHESLETIKQGLLKVADILKSKREASYQAELSPFYQEQWSPSDVSDLDSKLTSLSMQVRKMEIESEREAPTMSGRTRVLSRLEKQILELQRTIQQISELHRQIQIIRCFMLQPAAKKDITDVLETLEKEGARYIRQWMEESALVDGARIARLCRAELILIHRMLKGPNGRKFIQELPRSVRGVQNEFFDSFIFVGNSFATSLGAHASSAEIIHYIERALHLAGIARNIKATTGIVDASDLKEIMLKLPKIEPWLLSKATELFQSLESLIEENEGCTSTQPTRAGDARNTSAVVDLIEPCIYARTPMCAALQDMANIFGIPGTDNVLLILSDGDSTDGDPRHLAANLKKRGVTIVSCLLTNEDIPNPRQLYGSNKNPGTNNASRAMYDMSSSVSNGTVAMRMLTQQGWKISTTGESRLFVQANHPAVIDEFVGLVGRLLRSNDVLVDMVARVPLDLYVQNQLVEFPVPHQKGETCYANAIGAVYHLAMTRIYEREGGIPKFEEIRKHIIEDHGFGSHGANTAKVLEKVSSDYRLHSKEVDETGAREALNMGHPLVATFALKVSQWSEFTKFFKENKAGVLDIRDISTPGSGILQGHAVVLIGYNRNSMRFMNSWGDDFADDGFFRIRSAQVLSPNQPMRFFHVFWYESELTDSERNAYRKCGADKLKEMARRFNKALQIIDYECPKCRMKSPLNNFKGNIFRAECRRCGKEFTPRSMGEEFVTNIYLRQL